VTARCTGAMVLDVNGKVVHATGIACRASVQRDLCDHLLRWNIGSGVVPLSMPDGPHGVQLLHGVDTDIVLLFSEAFMGPSEAPGQH